MLDFFFFQYRTVDISQFQENQEDKFNFFQEERVNYFFALLEKLFFTSDKKKLSSSFLIRSDLIPKPDSR